MDGIETTTVHDWKPSHNPKPVNLMHLEAAMAKAWWDYDALIEQRLDWWAGIRSDEVTQEQIDQARDHAVQAQQAYWSAWRQENEQYPRPRQG